MPSMTAPTSPAPLDLTLDQVRRIRMERSGLVAPLPDAESVTRALVGVQAQILPAAGLALWNRTHGLTNTQYEHSLFEDRTLVKIWGQRGTLHLYESTEWPLIYAARSAETTWWERRVAKDGEEAARDHRRKVEEITAALREREAMGRNDLRALEMELHEEFFSGWGGIFADVVRLGYACHAGRDEGEGKFAHRERWLPALEWNPPSAEDANIEVARRYFAAYGPSTLANFAYWRGVAVSSARRWVAALGDELAEVRVEGAPMLALRRDLEPLAALPAKADGLPVKLLYRFDPLLLGHRERAWVIPPEFNNRVSRPAGHIEGVVLHRGRAVATWRYDRKGAGLIVTVSPFKPLPKGVSDKLPRLAEGVAGFFALSLSDLRIEAA